MKLTGEEDVTLCIEKDGKPYFTISQLNLDQLLNDVIVDRIDNELHKKDNIQRFDTRYIIINNRKVFKDSIIRVKVRASVKEDLPEMKNKKYNSIRNSLRVQNFYNFIIGEFEYYSCEFDTDINNIKLELLELEIVEEKPLIRIKICCSDGEYFNDYIDTIKKYSIDDINIRKNENSYGYFADIYVESLNFLLQFVEDIKPLNASKDATHNGFIFTMIEKGYYCIEIYNGWIE